MSKSKRKAVPVFTSEEEEREYWTRHDSTDHVEWAQAEKRSFPQLRPTLRTISLRLPESMIGQLKLIANKRDIPYQSLLKQFLAERLQIEQARSQGPNPPSQPTGSARD